METSLLITNIVQRLQGVSGIEAIVLGGSRARGTHTESSDIDLGIYYSAAAALDIDGLGRVAAEIDDSHRTDLVTGIGGWGPWINGGGWLTVAAHPVDLIYREREKVARVISDCRAGRFETAYQPGHPHGFMSYIYLSEVGLCRPLWDPQGTVSELKAQALPYPPLLRRAIINAFWWEADFSLRIAHKSVSRGDVAYAAGCCFRCVSCLAQTLFAINEQYWMNEKGAVAIAAALPHAPTQLKERVAQVFAQLDGSAQAIEGALATLQALVDECIPIVNAAAD